MPASDWGHLWKCISSQEPTALSELSGTNQCAGVPAGPTCWNSCWNRLGGVEWILNQAESYNEWLCENNDSLDISMIRRKWQSGSPKRISGRRPSKPAVWSITPHFMLHNCRKELKNILSLTLIELKSKYSLKLRPGLLDYTWHSHVRIKQIKSSVVKNIALNAISFPNGPFRCNFFDNYLRQC